MARVIHIFWDSDLRGRQPSLAAQARKRRNLSVRTLKEGELIVFINRAKTKVALLAPAHDESFGVMHYYSSPSGKISEQAIQYVPLGLGGAHLSFDAPTKRALEDQLSQRK